MAVLVIIDWPQATLANYDEVKRITNFEVDQPPGGIHHVVAADGDRLRIVDVWESPETFQAFLEGKVIPATQQIGLDAQPDIKILPTHNIFAPRER